MEHLDQKLNQKSQDEEVVVSNGIKYSVKKLIEIGKTIKPQDTEITEFENTMNTECWDDLSGKMIKPNEVLEAINNGTEISALKDHIDRVKNSDPSRPILVVNIEGESVVVDGVHRLVKSFFDNKTSIPVVRFDSLPIEAQQI